MVILKYELLFGPNKVAVIRQGSTVCLIIVL